MQFETLLETLEHHHKNVIDKWSCYITSYDEILGPHRASVQRMLEIGVQNGGSLEVWADYFPALTHAVGCDINERCRDIAFSDPRISLVVGDATRVETRAEVEALSPRYELIIDDGSHTSGDIIRAFFSYFPLLEPGGLFVIEDLHCSYWQHPYHGGLHYALSAMNFLKTLADLINREHWQDRNTPGPLGEFARHYRLDLDWDVLSQIHSLEFRNSLAVIRKRPAGDNLLGPRQVYGQVATVVETIPDLQDSLSVPPELEPMQDLQQRLHARLSRALQHLQEPAQPVHGPIAQFRFQAQSFIQYLEQARFADGEMAAMIPVLSAAYEDLAGELRQLSAEIQESDEDAAAELAGYSDLTAQIRHLEEQLESHTKLLQAERAHNAALGQEISALTSSLSWRLTAPLRRLVDLFQRSP